MKCVIVCGATILDYEKAASYIEKEDFVIACDSGLYHTKALGVEPDLIVGDFDSHPKPDTKGEIIELPREKDDTDSVFALKEGIKRGFEEFLFLGALGKRFDHGFVNVSSLLMLDSIGKKGMIVDDYCEMEVISSEAYVSEKYPYFSLLNISGEKNDISISGAKFPLDHKEITMEYQYGVSNEVLPKETAHIVVHKGRILLVRDFD